MRQTNTVRLFASTRGKVIAALRRGVGEAEEIAHALGISANAVRTHLGALERAGLVERDGVRRSVAVGKPPTWYRLRPEAELVFSRAYPPVLGALLNELTERLPPEQVEQVMHAAGRRLAASLGERPTGDIDAKARAGLSLLAALGGLARVERVEGAVVLQGAAACPLASAVVHQPGLCGMVESLLSEFLGLTVEQTCDHTDRPRCRFRVSTAA